MFRIFRKSFFAVSAAFLFVAGSANASSILYWSDLALGTDQMAAALAASSHTVTTASDESNFVTQVGLGGWDLVIFMNQNTSNTNAHTAIQSWVTSGGASIFSDWTRNSTTGSVFDVTYDGTNKTSFTVTDPTLAAGLTNPVSLTNPGWGTFSMDMTGDIGANTAATFDVGGLAAIVIGNGGKTIVNGFLNDTFTDGNEGIALYTNEIGLLLNVPEPASMALLGIGLAGLGAMRRKHPYGG